MTRKFAQITASILARKGEAMPSLVDEEAFSLQDVNPAESKTVQAKPAEHPHFRWASELRQAFVADITSGKQLPKKAKRKPLRAGTDPATKKLFLKVSTRDNERLEIAAVKLGATRNELLKNAILSYLDELTREFETSCGCIAGRSGEGEACCAEMQAGEEPERRLA